MRAGNVRCSGNPTKQEHYNALLPHNGTNRPLLEELAQKLENRGLSCWLSKWNLISGNPWQSAIELGCLIEEYVGSNEVLGKEAEAHFWENDPLGLGVRARQFRKLLHEEHNWYEHCPLLMRHPVINAAYRLQVGIIYRLPRISSVPDSLSKCR
jgi:hypothetical protein